jgi:polar amino acid transport system substrate-binding protein
MTLRIRAVNIRVLLVAAIATAAGVDMTPGVDAARQAPARVAAKGTLVYCSNISYPPEEFYRGIVRRGREFRPRPVGSDIDIGTEVAKRLGLDATFVHREFKTIISDLRAEKCDAIISGINDTPTRRKQVAFVDYLSIGQSLMVRKGNPKGIRTLADLSGKSVSVELGTTNKGFLDRENRTLRGAGKRPINIVAFTADTDAAAALRNGKVDAYFGDAPVVAYYIAHSHSFAFGGQPVNPLPVGIALRKGDSNIPKIQKAVNAMYADGTMKRILARWNMSAFALKK